MRRFWLLPLAAMISTGYAAIYVNQTGSDTIEYSDTPSVNAAVVTVPPVNTVAPQIQPTAPSADATARKPSAADSTAAASTTDTYKIFQILKPMNGETIQNQPVIPVEMKIEPVMKAGDKVQLFIDGSPVGVPTGSSYQEIGLVERGTHSLYGTIINSNNQPIKRSNNITLYVHRNSTVTSPQTPPPKPPAPPVTK